MRAAAALGLRVVNLQHDGIVVMGVEESKRGEVEAAMGEAVTGSCGYKVQVTLEKVRHVDRVD